MRHIVGKGREVGGFNWKRYREVQASGARPLLFGNKCPSPRTDAQMVSSRV